MARMDKRNKMQMLVIVRTTRPAKPAADTPKEAPSAAKHGRSSPSDP